MMSPDISHGGPIKWQRTSISTQNPKSPQVNWKSFDLKILAQFQPCLKRVRMFSNGEVVAVCCASVQVLPGVTFSTRLVRYDVRCVWLFFG